MFKTFIKYFFVWSLSVLILSGGLVLIQKSGMFPQLFPKTVLANPSCDIDDDVIITAGHNLTVGCVIVESECTGNTHTNCTGDACSCFKDDASTWVSCPAGKYIMGGGCGDWEENNEVLYSAPMNNNAWQCGFNGEITHRYSAFGICCNINVTVL